VAPPDRRDASPAVGRPAAGRRCRSRSVRRRPGPIPTGRRGGGDGRARGVRPPTDPGGPQGHLTTGPDALRPHLPGWSRARSPVRGPYPDDRSRPVLRFVSPTPARRIQPPSSLRLPASLTCPRERIWLSSSQIVIRDRLIP